MNRALILTDGKAGHENQSKAFARAMGCDFDLLRVDFRSKFAKAASYALDWMGILSLKPFVDFRVPPSRYDIVVSESSLLLTLNNFLTSTIGLIKDSRLFMPFTKSTVSVMSGKVQTAVFPALSLLADR